MSTTGNIGLDALADAIAERVIERINASKPQPRLLNTKDASVYIGRSEDALRRLEAKKVIVGVRRDNRLFFDRQDLDRWIELGKARG